MSAFNLLPVVIFSLILGPFLLVYLGVQSRKKAKQSEAFLTSLKQQLTMNQRAAVEESMNIKRNNAESFWFDLPIIGGWINRIWLDFSLLGWQEKWRSRATLLATPCLLLGFTLGKSSQFPIGASVLLSLGFFFALIVLLYRNAMGKHLKEFKQNLPQAIDSIVRVVKAGVPATNAFGLIANNLPGPLAKELALIDKWLSLGLSLRQAMQDSAIRVPLNEYRFFAVILVINQEAGGRLSDTLERLSETLRERQELALKIRAKTSEVRASAVIVAMLAPLSLAYMYFNSPKDFQFLLSDPTGNSVLIYAFGSVLTGLAITHFMIKRVIR
ncbi:type II secretion system F family protein [Marinomonas mediterranea]|uniref:type II secretion system F family protein n=1 Tax=Marinomonas mediterranea TaxID=119864 RepID=UPI00234A2D60|nr:type II secretion system F family protein [Marinomonas mediterranea]WCN11205.1 secretion system protein [Marinomonas mediterranea]